MNEDCKKYQSMIESFISDKLTGVECKDFICHVKKCNECMDELQVNYVIASVLEELEDDSDRNTVNSKKNISKNVFEKDDSDYIAGLNKKIDDALEMYTFRLKNFMVPIMLSLATILLILIALIFK